MPSRLPTRDETVFATLTLAGFSFWFLLGFPYANHNESFAIVAQLKEIGMVRALTSVVEPVATRTSPFVYAVSPVPPCVTATVPVTLAAVPEVLAAIVPGISADTIERNVGAAAAPVVGPA